MAEHWSRAEVEATVASYLDMLESELAGVPSAKANRERALLAILPNRSMGAVRYKLCNVSAALVDLDNPYVEGYKPYPNYQELLLEVTAAQLDARPALLALIEAAVTKPAGAVPAVEDDRILVDPPVREKPAKVYERRNLRPVAGKDYLQMEARNSSLGRAGEEFVLEFERKRLWASGHKRLAERVEHVAVTKGDGLGFDIHSYEDSGRDRWIEVKTTRFGSLTPFYVTRHEVETSDTTEATYSLYRVFRFERPQLYVVDGSLRQRFELDPVQFSARVR